MSHETKRDVEQEHCITPGTVLCLMTVFGMLVLLLAGNVRLYEKREEARSLSQTLTQQQQELQELQQELQQKEPLRTRAEALGMEEIDPQKVTVLHIKTPRGK